MGKPKRYDHMITLRLAASMLARIDEWRRAKALRRSDAIRALIDKALIADGIVEQLGENETAARYHGA